MSIPLRLSSPGHPVGEADFTALRNFAALRGQLRVSFTPHCNALCWFCHNEGDVPPPRLTAIAATSRASGSSTRPRT